MNSTQWQTVSTTRGSVGSTFACGAVTGTWIRRYPDVSGY